MASAPADSPPLTLPAMMWATPALLQVRHKPDSQAEKAGTLHRGDAVQVLSFLPDDKGSPTWALIAGGYAVAAASLAPLATRPPEAELTNAAAQFAYARVKNADSPEFVSADATSRRRGRQPGARLLAFVPDKPLLAKGWLRHAGGGYMMLRDLQLLTPSQFSGEHEPKLPLALVLRRTQLRSSTGTKTPHFVNRYDRLPLISAHGDSVEVPGGTLARARVRLAQATARPPRVPLHGKWLHIDLNEQTLVAHEGDKAVFATLISTGRDPHLTTKGLFRIYAKTVHTTMRGTGPKGYVAEEVPWAMHYFRGEALHGAYWHDQFGVAKSHGCLNMSPADAKWLFAWVTPPLPPGWHGRLLGAGEAAVYVEVVQGGRLLTPLAPSKQNSRSEKPAKRNSQK